MSIWITRVAFMALVLFAPLPAAEETGTAGVVALAPGALEAANLDPALRELLPGLVTAALESGGGHTISQVRQGATRELKLAVTGRGPWRLSARVEGIGPAAREKKVVTKKYTFSDRDSLTGAVDALVSEIHLRLQPGGEGAPLPLALALSGSESAVDAYVAGMKALRAGNASAARLGFDTALEADRSFCRAAAERVYFDLTTGRRDNARSILETARAGGVCRAPGVEEMLRAMELLIDDSAAALQLADKMSEAGSRRGHAVRGMALAMSGRMADARDDWKLVTAADPDDPRGQVWLGSSLMAMGDFAGAAEALARVNSAWPELLSAWTLRAEAQARMREPGQAKDTLTAMKAFMSSRHLAVDADEHNPDLLLGSVDLLEGHTVDALRKFEASLSALEKAGAPVALIDMPHNAIIAMRRDLILSRDPVAWQRQVQDASEAIDRYESSQTPEHRITHPWELSRLRGLVSVREGKTVDAWKIVEEIRSHAGEPGYSEYYEAHLSAAIMLKEGDERGSTAQFERAARARGRIVDLIDLAQMQGNMRRYDDSRATYEEIARRLERYDPRPGPDPGVLGELILCDPHLAAMIPIYHYTRARLAYETNNPTESRLHFNRMLKYLKVPDAELMPLVKEAIDRGARPE